MTPSTHEQFNHYYSLHCKHLKLRGYRPKTIEAYTRAIRRVGEYFDYQIDNLSHDQLLDYFHSLLERLSWSAVKLDLYGLQRFYIDVLKKPWINIPVVKPPKTKRIPDIVTIDEVQRLFKTTKKLSYRVLFFTLYSLGLRLGEGLRLQVGDIDEDRMRVHVRNAKGNKDRFLLLQNLHIPHICTPLVLQQLFSINLLLILHGRKRSFLMVILCPFNPVCQGGVLRNEGSSLIDRVKRIAYPSIGMIGKLYR
jgi:site-specific recombinase XerD